RLDPAGNVMTPEQVAEDDDEQPEPDDEHEYREDVGQEVAECEAFSEEHRDSPSLLAGLPAPARSSLVQTAAWPEFAGEESCRQSIEKAHKRKGAFGAPGAGGKLLIRSAARSNEIESESGHCVLVAMSCSTGFHFRCSASTKVTVSAGDIARV